MQYKTIVWHLKTKQAKNKKKKKSGGERAGELGRNTKTPALCWWTYTGSGTATLTWSLMCCPQPSHWFLYSSSICAVGLVSPLKEGSQPSLCAFSLGFSRLGTFQAITFVSDCVFSPLYPELCFGLPFLKCLPLNGATSSFCCDSEALAPNQQQTLCEVTSLCPSNT